MTSKVFNARPRAEFQPAGGAPEASARPGGPHSLWDTLQVFSTHDWCATLPVRVLNSRTPFAEFLRQTLHADRLPVQAPVDALFPLPIPKTGVFSRRKCGSRERSKRVRDRAFHITVMALNFWHADCKFVPRRSLQVLPSAGQLKLLDNLKKLFKAFGSCQDRVSIPDSGRRSATLLSLLSDLSDFLNWEGLAGDAYTRVEVSLVQVVVWARQFQCR